MEMASMTSNFPAALAGALQYTDDRHNFLPSFCLKPR